MLKRIILPDLEVLVTMTLKVTEDHKDRWGRIKEAELKQTKKKPHLGTSLVVQWLRVFPCRGCGFNLQWGVPYDAWCGQKNRTQTHLCVRAGTPAGGGAFPCPAIQKFRSY